MFYTLVFLIVASNILLPIMLSSHLAFADGFNHEILPSNVFGNRQPALSVSTTPPVIISGANPDILLHFRLYDVKTNETIKFPTLKITITEGNDTKAKPLLQDFFQSQTGLLTLQIYPRAEGNVTLQANREPFLYAWTPDPGGTVKVFGPIFEKFGTYHIRVDVFGIDFPTNIFADKDVIHFDNFVSVREVRHIDVQLPLGSSSLSPAMLQECSDLGITREKCSEIEILKHRCLGGPGIPCGSSNVSQPELDPLIAEILAGLGVTLVASIFGIRKLRTIKKKKRSTDANDSN